MNAIHGQVTRARSRLFSVKAGLSGLAAASAALMMVCSGCTHALVVKNLDSYRNNSMHPLNKPTTIGMLQDSEDPECQKLVKGIGRSLGSYSATVFLPYSTNSDKRADVIADVKITPQYSGSGWNFLINWPGFLIFTPAWHGYNYHADLQFDVTLTNGKDNSRIDSWTTPVKLDLRQAEFDRTWTEIGWLEWGVIPLIGGIVFTRYDADVTPQLMDKIEAPIGDYIAQEIVDRINNPGASRPSGKPAGTQTTGH